jgi:UDP-N-acetyl-D-galactosamine dehydrogenase
LVVFKGVVMNYKIGVLGLGYVGLPLAAEFGKIYSTVGFDINSDRIKSLHRGIDKTLEMSAAELNAAKLLEFSSSIESLKSCNVYIVTVPTPITESNEPDLSPLIKASEMLGQILKKK